MDSKVYGVVIWFGEYPKLNGLKAYSTKEKALAYVDELKKLERSPNFGDCVKFKFTIIEINIMEADAEKDGK